MTSLNAESKSLKLWNCWHRFCWICLLP